MLNKTLKFYFKHALEVEPDEDVIGMFTKKYIEHYRGNGEVWTHFEMLAHLAAADM